MLLKIEAKQKNVLNLKLKMQHPLSTRILMLVLFLLAALLPLVLLLSLKLELKLQILEKLPLLLLPLMEPLHQQPKDVDEYLFELMN